MGAQQVGGNRQLVFAVVGIRLIFRDTKTLEKLNKLAERKATKLAVESERLS